MQLDAPAYDRLRRALASPPPAGAEARRHPRVVVSGPAVILPLGDDASHPVRARVADLSPEGIAVLLARPLTIGSEMLLQGPPDGADARPLQVRCLVRSSALVADDCYRVGAEFIAIDAAPCLLDMGARDFE